MAVPEQRALPRPLGAARGVVVAVMDGSEVSRSSGALAMRRLLAALFIGYAGLLAIENIRRGNAPTMGQLVLAIFGAALLGPFSARFIRDWTFLFAGIFAYVLAGRYAEGLKLSVFYSPQLDADKLIGLGTTPTAWLQSHLYHGKTGPLEVFAVAMYASHFAAPILLAFYLWVRRMSHAFAEFMFAVLATSVLADIVFILFPTAPPWLAAQHGRLPGVHHLLKESLLDLHLTGVASVVGDSHRYNVVAAFPSIHAAFPVIALCIALRYGLPKWLVGLQAAQLLGVFFAVVYLGDHYVVDVVGGAALAVGATTLVHTLLVRSRAPSQHMPEGATLG